MIIPFNISQAFYPGANKVLNAKALRRLMQLLVGLNRDYLIECKREKHPVPDLYVSGVYYARTTVWEPVRDLYARTWGDCKSLSGAMVAQLQLKGVRCEPVFRWVERPNGNTDYHILVQMPGGKFEDPSKVLGMPHDEITDFYGPGSWAG